MQKKIAFKINLPGNPSIYYLSLPNIRRNKEGILDFLHILIRILTIGFIFLIPFSPLLKLSTINQSVNLVIVVYIFIIILATLQFIRLSLGGDSFFPKVAYDLFMLALPPIVIAATIFGNNLDNIFATKDTWNFSGITFIALMILPYLLGINFSNKRGENFLMKVILNVLLIASVVFFVDPASIMTGFNAFMIVMGIPLFFKLFFGKNDAIEIFLTTLNLIFSLIFLALSDIPELYFIYFAVISIILVLKLARAIKGLVTMKGGLKIVIPVFNKKLITKFLGNKDLVGKALIAIGYIFSLSKIIQNDLFNAFARQVQLSLLSLGSYSQYLAFGVKLKDFSVSSSFLGTFITIFALAYGVIATAVIIFFTTFLLIKTLRRIKESESKSILFSFFTILTFVIITLVSGTQLLFMLFVSIAIGLLIIEAREKDIYFSDIKVLDFSKVKNQRLKIALHIFRIIFLLITFVLAYNVIVSLTEIVRVNLV